MQCAFSVFLEAGRVQRSKLAALFNGFATIYDADMFLSGVTDDDTPLRRSANKCIIGIDPVAELIVQPQTTREEIKSFCFDTGSESFGYLSYTYGLKERGIHSDKKNDLPLGHLRQYSILITVDISTGLLECSALESANTRTLHRLKDFCTTPPRLTELLPECSEFSTPTPSMNRDEYIDGVQKVLEHIRSGDTYQLCLSSSFSMKVPESFSTTTATNSTQTSPQCDAVGLFLHLWQNYPAAYYTWFTSEDVKIISTSPECFLRVEEGTITSEPIKGTVAFDTFSEQLLTDLRESPKESAELSMIVDLIRNDISAHCDYGSVSVERHKDIFTVDNMLQMYSIVKGTLKKESTCLDLLFDAFPGGSITGCPKLRTMKIIEQLEPHSRDLYCGSFIHIKNKTTMNSSIAIRTGWFTHDHSGIQLFRYFAGSGLVIDSVPELEFDETIAKAEKFRKVLST
ncbi:chorismate-binding protein [Halodesulfovibrio sp.]|jgi:para-aminobenzoate synthetase component 1|uniref:chorismate-binding protein n=1 Tax=Halodesulfovibrio sp. TaxID=1912772 RepID=UPI0025D599DF|nr:chorismate-binding protein [Halodesulfovibrio sp.]MCT4627679.1 chorismate-binding protein [Halodesulfovibrio sp.]